MAAAERKIPAPQPNPETQGFWDAAEQGKFVIRRCRSCGKAHWYPRAICPFCASQETEWVEASGRAKIYSYSVMRRVPEPYAIAYVTLAEGPTMLTNLVDCDLDALRIGQEVRVAFKPSEGGPPVPAFTPAVGNQ
jgi:uncharacterized OB-fold protein